ncbi:unnamed protein product [Ixodes pacificus]
MHPFSTEPEVVSFAAVSGPFDCRDSALLFPLHSLLDDPQRAAHGHGEDKHQCRYCTYSSDIVSNVIRHERMHTGEKPFECHICGKALTRKTNLVAHLRSHTGEKPFSCQVCGKTFSKKKNLGYHMMTHTRARGRTCAASARGGSVTRPA